MTSCLLDSGLFALPAAVALASFCYACWLWRSDRIRRRKAEMDARVQREERLHKGERIIPAAGNRAMVAEAQAGLREWKTSADVEIVTSGFHSLVFVNGRRIGDVLEIELPVGSDHVGPQIGLKFLASQIVQRSVTKKEFDQLKGS